jgi:hypothetical protein
MAYGKSREEQEIIARQSQLKLVLDWATTCNKCLTLKELVGITNVMAEYVVDGYKKSIGDRLDTIEDHLDNKGFPTKE